MSTCIYSLSTYKHPTYTKDTQIYAHINTLKLGRAPREKPATSQLLLVQDYVKSVSGRREGS